jgi:hypothetical protein
MGAQLFHAGGRTDRQTVRRDESSNRFSQFLRTRLKIKAICVDCLTGGQIYLKRKFVNTNG